MTEREKMLAGELYDATDPELVDARARARRLTQAYNATGQEASDERQRLLRELLGRVEEGVWIEPPFQCDYGANIRIGARSFLNFGCIVLDCSLVEIGEGVLIGPAVQLAAASHPLDPAERRSGLEYGLPIRIGDNVWIGGGAIVGPGVTIGENTTIGAGSVVLRDVPAGVVAVGNPCKVVRTLGEPAES